MFHVAAHCKVCRAPSVPDIHGDPLPCQVCAGDPEAVRAEEARKAYGRALREGKDPLKAWHAAMGHKEE